MSEPTQDVKRANWRRLYEHALSLQEQRDALQDKLSDALALAAEVALGVTHSTICSKETPCVRCDRDALKAENERLKKNHSEDHFCCNEVPRLRAELAEMTAERDRYRDGHYRAAADQITHKRCQNLEREILEEWKPRAERAELELAALKQGCECTDCPRHPGERCACVCSLHPSGLAAEISALKTELAVVKRDHGQAILRGQAEREAKEEAQRKLEGLAEAQRQLNCDRDVELTNLRARVEQLREELTRAYKNGDAMVLEARERLAQVERERDEKQALLDAFVSMNYEEILGQRDVLSDALEHCKVAREGLRARVAALEAELRDWMRASDFARDITFVPIYKHTEALLAPASRESKQ